MTLLFFGDVVGDCGCEALEANLRKLKAEYGAGTVIVNGENSAEGNGITPDSAARIFAAGADVITTGNHVFHRKELYDMLDTNEWLLRPANYGSGCHGSGVCVLDFGRFQLAVVNMMGRAYLQDPVGNPFDRMDEILNELAFKNIFVDFHGESTGEKKAFGFFLDGRVTAVLGTHTHVQTADAQILPHGTAYQSDVGMCGPYCSVLGVEPALAIERMRTDTPVRFKNADGDAILCFTAIDFDEKTGRASAISSGARIYKREG